LWQLCEGVGRLKRNALAGSTVTLKLKTRFRIAPAPLVVASNHSPDDFSAGRELLAGESDARAFASLVSACRRFLSPMSDFFSDLIIGVPRSGASHWTATHALRRSSVIKGLAFDEDGDRRQRRMKLICVCRRRLVVRHRQALCPDVDGVSSH